MYNFITQLLLYTLISNLTFKDLRAPIDGTCSAGRHARLFDLPYNFRCRKTVLLERNLLQCGQSCTFSDNGDAILTSEM